MQYLSHHIHLGDTSLHFVESGKGEPLVLVHGLTNNWQGHIPLAKVLGRTYRLYIPDLPGYGDSGKLSHYSIEIMSFYLSRFIRELPVRPRAIVGLSMGGLVVADLIKRYPHMVESGIILGPVLSDASRKAHTMGYVMQAADKMPGGRFLLKKWVETRLHGYLCAKYLNMYRFDRALIDKYGTVGRRKMTKDAYIEMGMSVARYDLATILTQIRVPILLLYGEKDKISCCHYAQEYIVPRNKFIRIATIPDAGHVVSFEKPEESGTAIMSFLATVS